MAETVFTRADLLAAEKQQLRLLIEQQHNPQSHAHPSSYASYAPPFPIISLSDDWQLNASPQPPIVSSTLADDYFNNYLNEDAATNNNSNKHLYPASSFSHYSATSDYNSTQPSPSPPSPSSYHDKLASYDQFTTSLKRPHHHTTTASDELPASKRLSVELPASAYMQHKKAGGQQSVALQAQYPLLSSELIDGFFTSNVNVGSGVMGGLDDSELGLGLSTVSRQASELSNSSSNQKLKAVEETLNEPQIVLPTAEVSPSLPLLSLEPQTSQLSQVSSSSSIAPSIPFQPSSLSSVLSDLSSSSVSSPFDNPSSLSNLANRLLPPDHKGEGQRRMKRRLTDKQRRAKIKDGLEHLRSLVALHGNASSDQASIVNSSVDLVQQLVDERESLKHQLRKAGDERVELEREQQLAIDKQRLAAAVLPSSQLTPAAAASASTDKAASPDLSVLLHHLSNILSPVLGGGAAAGGRADSSDSSQSTATTTAAATGGAAGGLEHLVLSQYFLHTLKLLTNLPRNNAV